MVQSKDRFICGGWACLAGSHPTFAQMGNPEGISHLAPVGCPPAGRGQSNHDLTSLSLVILTNPLVILTKVRISPLGAASMRSENSVVEGATVDAVL